MKRNTALKLLNPLLGVLLMNQMATGMFAEDLPRDAFEVLHEGGGYALVFVAVLHLILNWNWVKASYFKRSPVAKA